MKDLKRVVHSPTLHRKWSLPVLLMLASMVFASCTDVSQDGLEDESEQDVAEGRAATTPVPLPYIEGFASQGGSFKCSAKTCAWTSAQISISGVSKIDLSAGVQCLDVGNFETTDYIKISYQLDGGSWNSLLSRTGDFSPMTAQKTLTNSSKILVLKIEAKTSATNEIYVVKDLTVKKTSSTSGTVPSAWSCNARFYGTGDGCDCSCGAADPDCKGSGCTAQGCSNSACKAYHDACPSGQKCFVVTDKFGGKFTDVEKNPNTSHDNLFCWVAGPSNILAWSGWGITGSLKSTDDIFLYSQNYWPPSSDEGSYDSGDDAYDLLNWFFLGKAASGEDYPPGGGFYPSKDFPGYCGGTIGTDFYVGYCPEDMADDPKAIMKLLDAGYPAAIQMKGDVGGSDGGHVITLWGYSVSASNPNVMTGIFLSDSDDNKSSTNPPDRLFYRKVNYDGVWHILTKDGKPYKYIKYVYGLRRK